MRTVLLIRNGKKITKRKIEKPITSTSVKLEWFYFNDVKPESEKEIIVQLDNGVVYQRCFFYIKQYPVKEIKVQDLIKNKHIVPQRIKLWAYIPNFVAPNI